MKRMLKNLALAALVVLAGCSNIFAPAIKPRDPPAGANQGGTVRINIEGERSSARTLLPAASGGFTKYDLLFEDQAGLLPNVNEYNYTPNAEVTIPKGTWTVTVSAYLSDGAGGDRLAATGEAEVAAVYGETGEPVPVILRPVDTANDYTGNGTFAWNISFHV